MIIILDSNSSEIPTALNKFIYCYEILLLIYCYDNAGGMEAEQVRD